MTIKNVLLLLLNVAMICIIVILLVAIVDHIKGDKQYKAEMWKYEEVYCINDIHASTLDVLGIEEIFYYDWEETAHSLNIPVDSLTINAFLKHLFHDIQ
jgi:ABC-type bacteriocin/lantibiotic exporter with double-glycine peptidase domain